MKRFIILAGLIILLFLVLISIRGTSSSFAEIPRMINYQGMLTNDSGGPITDTLDLQFRIYNSETNGGLKWSETQNQVPIIDGLFNVILGSENLIDTLSFSEQYWLEVQVGSDIMPRLRFTSVGYAYRAMVADSATVAVSAPTGGGWVDNGTVIKLQTYSDSVGIGTGLPAEKLHVNGDIRLWNGGDIAFGDDETRIYESSDNLYLTADNDIYLQPDDDIYIRPDGGSDWIRIDPGAGEVGVGTTEPTEMLHVENSASGAKAFLKIETSHASNWGEVGMRIETPDNMWHLRMDDDSNNNLPDTGSLALRSQNSGIEVMTWTNDGHVGVGTTEPSAELDVNGDLRVTGAYKGNISSSSGSDGAPFPRPAYNSGWLTLAQGSDSLLTHNIGGDSCDYVVDIQFWDTSRGINIVSYGGYSDDGSHHGVWYDGLTTHSIRIFRLPNDQYADKVRIRIWVYE